MSTHPKPMPLVDHSVPRQALHRRSIDVHVFAREDGLFDLDANLIDVRSSDYALASGVRKAGDPVHNMWLRVTIDVALNIIAVQSSTDRAPYPGYCEPDEQMYQRLVGLSMLKGFRQAVKERLGNAAGCAHLTELSLVLPTAAIQALSEILDEQQLKSGQQPFEIDRCHALVSSSTAVRTYYPQWYKPPN